MLRVIHYSREIDKVCTLRGKHRGKEFRENEYRKKRKGKIRIFTGLPHTQGIQGNSGNFQVIENLRETQGILILFLKLREVLDFSKNFRKILRFFKESQGNFFLDLEWNLLNPVLIFCSKKLILFIFKCLFRIFSA